MESIIENPFKNKKYGLYIHIPFCFKKCPYCAFNVNIIKNIPEKNYLKRLKEEMNPHRNKKFKTVYIGGGTPNLMSNDFYKELFEIIDISSSEEITIELNPEFFTEKQLKFYSSLGINRFSLGIQTFSGKGLKILGRTHKNKDSFRAIDLLKGFNFSIDLIYGYPRQTLYDLSKDLEIIKIYTPPHLSIYNLTYEEGSFFNKWKRQGKLTPLNDDLELKMYLKINEILKETELKRYEISNFAQKGHKSVHNMIYWTSGPYIGIGSGAHSYYYEESKGIIRSEKERKLRKYLNLPLYLTEDKNILTRKEYIFDKFYSEMRKLYIDINKFKKETKVDLFKLITDNDLFKIIRDFIVFKDDKILFTEKGIINSDTVFEVFYDIIEKTDDL